jgi:hypothetical protein
MSTVTQLIDHHVTPPFTALASSLVDAAAAVETKQRDTERRLQVAERQLRLVQQYAQQYETRAQRWLVLLRRSHRRGSHAATGRLFKQVVTDLTAFAAPTPIGKE